MQSTFCILVYPSSPTAVWPFLLGWEGWSFLTMMVPAVDSSLHGPFVTCLIYRIFVLCHYDQEPKNADNDALGLLLDPRLDSITI